MGMTSLSRHSSGIFALEKILLKRQVNHFIPSQAEQEMETVVKVLQPGPLGIIEHKFSAEEIDKANATVKRLIAYIICSVSR
ncbi:hypothetical protein Tco_0323922 [Tanacetum coccineum]